MQRLRDVLFYLIFKTQESSEYNVNVYNIVIYKSGPEEQRQKINTAHLYINIAIIAS